MKKVTPGFTFCEIAQYFTGANPNVTGMFTQFSYNASKSEYKVLKPVFKSVDLITKYNKSIDHLSHAALDRFLNKIGFKFPLYEIPLSLIHNFYLVEAGKSYYQRGAFGVESIIDIMLQSGKSFFKDTFVEYNQSKGDDQTRIQRFTRFIQEERYDLYMLYLGILDYVGHYHGPESMKMRAALKWIDNQIDSIVETTLRKNPRTNIIILGDHGMSPVHYYIDILREFRRLKLLHNVVCGEDYIPFIDSSMCRIWTAHKGVEKLLINSLRRLKHGFLLDNYIAKKLEIPLLGSQIGELIWVCNEGAVIYPDYFHVNKPVVGMHGYATDSDIHKGLAVIISPQVPLNEVEAAKLIDICPTLCDLMEMKYPQKNQGRSLVK